MDGGRLAMFFKKDKVGTRPVSAMAQSLQSKTDTQKVADKESSSPLLERYLQKTMTDHMQNVDDEALAKAIQTLLYEDKSKNKNKHLN